MYRNSRRAPNGSQRRCSLTTIVVVCFSLFALLILGSLFQLYGTGSSSSSSSDNPPSSTLSPDDAAQAAYLANVFSYERHAIPLTVKSGMDIFALKLKDLELQAESGTALKSQLSLLSKQVQEMREQMRTMPTHVAPPTAAPSLEASTTPTSECPACEPCPAVSDCPTCEECSECPPCDKPSTSLSPGAPSGGIHAHVESSFKKRFDDYAALHNRIMDPKDSSVAKKYIYVSTSAQMNNRVRLLVTGIVIGMLTDRAVVSDFQYHAGLHDLFASPIDMEAGNHPSLPRNIKGSGKVVTVRDINSVLCLDMLQVEANVISITGGPSLIPLLYRNPHLHDHLHEWFGDEENIYHAVTKYFLPPSKAVATIVDDFVQANFEPASFVLGMHLRWGNDMRPNMPILDSEWNYLRKCAEAVVPSKYKNNVVWFVAADTQETREKAMSKLAKAGARTIVAAGERTVRSNTVPGVQAALADLLILAECDNLVLTPSSSYGEQAMALSGKPAYYTRDPKAHGGRLPKLTYQALHNVLPNEPHGVCARTYTSQPSIEGMAKAMEKAQCYHPDMHALQY